MRALGFRILDDFRVYIGCKLGIECRALGFRILDDFRLYRVFGIECCGF